MLMITLTALLLITAYSSWMSQINQFFFFGRTVPEDFASGAEGRAIVRRFVVSIWIGCALAVVLIGVLWREHLQSYILWPVMIEIVVGYFAFARANRETLRATGVVPAQTVMEVPLTTTEGRVPSLATLMIPIVVAAVAGVGSLAAAAVRGGSLRSAPEVLDTLLVAHGVETLFSFGLGMATAGLVLLLLRTRSRTRTPLAGNVLRSLVVSNWASAAALIASMVVVFAGGAMTRVESKAVIVVAFVAAVALNVVRMIRIRRFAPPAAELQADENWLWGMFYRNRRDPALFVQSRFGVGYTLNFGRATAWPLAIGFAALFLSTAVLATLHR